jgi:hypothetical protein
MKNLATLSSLAVILLLGVFSPVLRAAAQFDTPMSRIEQTSSSDAQRCAEEELILNSTVRFSIEYWVYRPADEGYDISYSNGHGTVMKGRYLVTHNHFGIPFPGDPDWDENGYEIISLYNQAGQRVFKGPLSDFELVRKAGESLVLAHADEGFFEALGFRSAEFAPWSAIPLEKGMVVAQVDWDGRTTRVDWVQVEEIILDQGTPRLVLNDGVLVGASGGGIYWQGTHVANNWLFQAKIADSGETYDEVTTAALNLPAALDF